MNEFTKVVGYKVNMKKLVAFLYTNCTVWKETITWNYENNYIYNSIKKIKYWDFPGGTVVKNPPANAGDTGSSPGPGRSHMPHSN